LWSALFVLGATHFLNPDAFIVKTNIALMQQGRAFDANYNSHLSDDAVPVLVNSFSGLNEQDQTIVLKNLTRRFCQEKDELDLRSWNLSRRYALAAMNETGSMAGQLDGCSSIPSERDDTEF